MPNLYSYQWGGLQGARVGEGKRSQRGLHGEPCNGEAKTIGDLNGPRLGGLSTIPSLTFSFESQWWLKLHQWQKIRHTAWKIERYHKEST